jgi:hypothetical protein
MRAWPSAISAASVGWQVGRTSCSLPAHSFCLKPTGADHLVAGDPHGDVVAPDGHHVDFDQAGVAGPGYIRTRLPRQRRASVAGNHQLGHRHHQLTHPLVHWIPTTSGLDRHSSRRLADGNGGIRRLICQLADWIVCGGATTPAGVPVT